MMSKVLVVDDHTIFRAGLLALLHSENNHYIVSEVADGRAALNATQSDKFDIVLMDLSMPNTNGAEAIETIKKRSPAIKVLTLTMHKEEEYVRSALSAGADGYALKDDTHEELLMAIKSLLAGKTYLSPSISQCVISGFLSLQAQPVQDRAWNTLTLREREVIKLVAEGRTNKQTADYLSLSPKTVEKHRSSLMKKLCLKNSSDLVVYAIENGLV